MRIILPKGMLDGDLKHRVSTNSAGNIMRFECDENHDQDENRSRGGGDRSTY